jgi:hypothetical protein
MRWGRSSAVFADRGQLRMVLAVLWPMGVYVGLIFGLGIYLASFVLIAYFMRRHGRYGWGGTVGVAAACRWSSSWCSNAGSWCRCPRARSNGCWGSEAMEELANLAQGFSVALTAQTWASCWSASRWAC